MRKPRETTWRGLLLAMAIPVLALGAQWVLWPYIDPFVWFLFFPAVFFSARVGGLVGGMAAAALSTLLVWHFFVPVPLSWRVTNPNNYYSMAMFLFVGYLISDSQQRLKQANRRVEEALAAANAAKAEITVLYRKTLELDELKTRFFTNVSHELRTPLTLILGPTEKCLSGELDPATRSLVELIHRNAQFLHRHVSDLLDIAKLEANRMTVDYAATDLAHLVRAMASNFETAAQERSIRFSVQTPEHMPARTDTEKVQRIVLNLVSNALKFTPDAGEVRVSLAATDGGAVLRVEDSGPGIPPDLREAVFERFRQIDGGAERRHEGTGLGLAIVREFAQILGGRVAVDEAPAGGARFTVSLPLAAPPGAVVKESTDFPDSTLGRELAAELRRERSAQTPPGAAARQDAPLVLVVEDNPDMNAFIAAALSARYRIAVAGNGEEGLAKAREQLPDLILTDVMMPGMTGDRMVEELRARPELADTPVVMLTAKADEELRVRMLKSGVQDYINKPFSMDELLARVDALLVERGKTLAMRGHLASIVESSNDAIVGMTLEGVITSWSPGAERVFGYAAREAVGRPVSMLHPPELAHQERQILDRLRQGEKIGHFDGERLHKDGRRIIASVLVSPIRDGAGRITGVSMIARDVTARRRMEEDLRRAKEEAELANAAKSVFLANMSHEIRTPLNGLMGMMQLLGTTPLDPEQGEYAKVALRSGNRLTQLLSDVLDFSTLEADRMPLRPAAFSLREVLRSVAETFDPLCKEKGVPLRTAVDDRIPAELVGDPARIRQVLLNIVGNAMKFTETGSVAIEAQPLRSADPEQSRVLVSVQDTGVGIPAEKIDLLCAPFTQADGSSTRRQQGAGLGLALTSRLVALMQGDLAIESEQGQGTTVSIMLPFRLRNGNGNRVGEAAGHPGPAPRRGLRILLAEDDAVNRMAAQHLLEKAGHSVQSAGDGREALALLAREPFDCVLMDIQMPDMDGIAATRAIRQDASGRFDPRLPIIAMTAYALAGDRETILAAGLDAYLAKPIHPDELEQAVQQAVAGRAAGK